MRRSNYSSMVLPAIKENFRCAEAFLLRTGRFFSLFSSKIETSCQKNKKKHSDHELEIPCGTKFLRVLILSIFAIFPAIRKNNFPPKKLTKTFFPHKFTLDLVFNILWLKFTTQKYSTKKSCLFNYNSPFQFRNKTVYNELQYNTIQILLSTPSPWGLFRDKY